MTSLYSFAKSRTHAHASQPPPRSKSASSCGNRAKSESDSTLRSTFGERSIAVEDDALVATAEATKHRIDWGTVMLSARVGPARWQPQSVASDCNVYTRQESSRFDVLAVALVPGCVAEILNVLQCDSSEQYAQQMEGIYESHFRDGEILRRVDTDGQPLASDDARLAELTVKRVCFNKATWYANHEEWCYTDAVYRSPQGGAGLVVEKLMTTVPSSKLVTSPTSATTTAFHDVVCGYLLRAGAQDPPPTIEEKETQPQRVPRETRVSFYAEFQIPKQIGYSLGKAAWRRATGASDKTTKQRLLRLAESTGRLTTLVRRQRLGLQVLVDTNRFVPPTNTPCRVCTRVLLVAKLCRMCGQGVCGDCSGKHERVRRMPESHALELTHVRVCVFCLERTDQAEYGNLTSSSLLGAHFVPAMCDTTPASPSLRDLLEDALKTAPSPTRKASVQTVIKCVLDQAAVAAEGDKSGRRKNSLLASPVLTPTSSDGEYIQALDGLACDDVSLRSDDHRVYQLDTSGTATAVPTPVPDNEDERLEAVSRMSVPELATVVELEILCELAAREMACTTSVIALLDRDQYMGVASNVPELRGALVPRTQAMCAHTIMESQTPLLVPHPEMDIRFSKFDSVDQYGVRFYCAFPLIGEDGYVVGSMCCVNGESLEVSEAQLAAFQRLAATASKVMRVETEHRQRRKDSTTSSTAADHA